MANEPVDIAQAWQRAIQPLRITLPEGASPHMRDIIAALNSGPLVFKGPRLLEIVHEPLQRLKAAPAEERVAFVFEAAGHRGAPASISLRAPLDRIVSVLLRAGLPLTNEEAVRLIEKVSRPQLMFPYKVLLATLQNVPMTSELRGTLLRLRPMITRYHGGTEMKEIHERIDALVYGAKEEPVTAAT